MNAMVETGKTPHVATGIVIKNDKGEVLLGKSVKYGDCWIIPGGHLEHGETLKQCARREVKEELGIDLINISFLTVQESIKTPPSDEHFVFINYSADMADPNATIKLESREFSDYCFIDPINALADLELNDSTRRSLELLCSGQDLD